MSVFIGTNKADEDDVALLPLEAIHRIDGDEGTERLEESILLHQLSEILHLCLVGGDKPKVHPFVQQALLANLGDVFLQFLDAECGFGLVDASEAVAHKLFVAIHTFRVYPYHGRIEIQDAPIFHFGCRREHAMIEPIR